MSNRLAGKAEKLFGVFEPIKTFKVYKHPIRGLEAVKVGFSWPAFFFAPIWMVSKNLWAYAGIWIGISFASQLLMETLADKSVDGIEKVFVLFIVFSAAFLLLFIPASKGNEWREADLTQQGYKLLSTVQAETNDAAIAKAGNLPIASHAVK